jgi:hypothetical protein
MGNNNATGKLTARRAATFLAALGMLVMSSGIALMVAATPANAAENLKVVVCKYVSTPGGELDHIVVVADNTLPDDWTPGDFPFEWTDAQGQSSTGSIAVRYAHDGEQANEVPLSDCPQAPQEDTPTTAHVSFTDPTCDVAAAATPDGGAGVDYAITDGSVAAGQSVTFTATAQAGFVINGDAVFTHDFSAAPTDCGSTDVSPPVVSPPTVVHHTTTTTTTVTPTVVHAGLAGVSAQDMRGEQGLALVFAGMLLLLGAGGLGLRSRTSRI